MLVVDKICKNFKDLNVLENISFTINSGETVGLIGKSGSGKSTLGKIILLLDKPTSGNVYFENQNIHQLKKQELFVFKRSVQAIFQNPHASLNPRMNIKEILAEPLDIHGLYPGVLRNKRLEELLDQVGLQKEFINRYPHELSGGQSQRVCIARALSVNPKLLICDEALSALDLSVQAQIINLLNDCQKQLKLSLLFISHDPTVVHLLSDQIITLSSF